MVMYRAHAYISACAHHPSLKKEDIPHGTHVALRQAVAQHGLASHQMEKFNEPSSQLIWGTR